MIREFLCFALLVSAVGGFVFWWVKTHGRSQGRPQSIDRHEGNLPDSYFDPGSSGAPTKRKSDLLLARKNKGGFRR